MSQLPGQYLGPNLGVPNCPETSLPPPTSFCSLIESPQYLEYPSNMPTPHPETSRLTLLTSLGTSSAHLHCQ